MKTSLLVISASALMLTSCVSNKKYAELESEVERLRSTEAVLAAVSKKPMTDEHDPMDPENNPEIITLRTELENVHKEMNDLRMKMDAKSAGDMTEQEYAIYEQEKMRAHEMEMMELHQQPQTEMKESERLFVEQNQKMNFVNKAARAAFVDYKNNEVTIDEKSMYTVITVKKSLLFSSDGNSISASGQTFINRLKPVLEISRGTELSLNGIASNAEDKETAFHTANVLDQELTKLRTYKTFAAPVMVMECDNALSGRKSNCDKIEIVIRPKLDEAMKQMQLGR